MEGHPCLDELHESRKIQALIKIGPDKDIQAPIKIGTGDCRKQHGRIAANQNKKGDPENQVTRSIRKNAAVHCNRNVTAALFPEC